MGNQGEEFAAQIDNLLKGLSSTEYNSPKAQEMWAEMIGSATPEKKEELPKAVPSNNEETEILKTSQGPVEINEGTFQNIGLQQTYLQQVPMYDYYFPQPEQAPQNYGYYEPKEQENKEALPQTPQVETLMDKLGKSI